MRRPYSISTAKRPWCLPCRAEGARVWAEHLGVACDWHFGILSEANQAALREAVRRQHPRGGRVTTAIGQIWVVRQILRNGDIPNTVEKVWADDLAEVIAQDEENERLEAAESNARLEAAPACAR